MTALDGWEAATHQGLERVRARELAALTPQQRMEWSEQALELAALSGALARARSDKQREIDRVWGRL